MLPLRSACEKEEEDEPRQSCPLSSSLGERKLDGGLRIVE
jgi:hypothetical protein